jgi:membrane associated rhomboid family serine protease
MIPLHDDNPTELKPYVTVAIIVICSLVFLWEESLVPARLQQAVYAFGFTPAVLFGKAQLPPELALIPPEAAIFTSMFLHGGWMHIIGNMLYLWIFGNNVEDAMGHGRFVVFYLVCGVAAALGQAFWEPGSTIPTIGASGAIAGVLGAYLILFPHARVMVIIPLGIFSRVLWVPAVLVLGLWIGLQLLQGALAPTGVGGVAYWAHIGGFVAGAILIVPFRRRGVMLFHPGRPHQGGGRGPWARGPWG